MESEFDILSRNQVFFFCIYSQNQKGISCVERTLRVMPSTRVYRVEVYRQEEDSDEVMVIQNMEKINWTAGDTLGSLRFRLYDEGGRLVPLTQNLAQNVKVIINVTLQCIVVPSDASVSYN